MAKNAVYVTDQELIGMRTKELNDHLKNCSKAEAKQIKTRRRLLKNRGYAQATRSKRVETKEQLGGIKEQLREEIEQLKKDLKNDSGDLIKLQKQREQLERELGEEVTSSETITIKTEDIYN